MHPFRVALAGLIDYAGLFPPASLDLAQVAENYLSYARARERWLLGRVVVPLARLDELGEAMLAAAGHGRSTPSAVTVIARPEDAIGDPGERIAGFNERFHSLSVFIVSLEIPAATPDDVSGIAAKIPDLYERYIEIPLDDRLPAYIGRIAEAGCYAKVRTGGIVAEAFPTSQALASFVNRCAASRVPFKATAGLHHPVRGSYPLTYETNSPSAVMHGFVNLVIAAGLLRERRINEVEAAALLETSDAAAIAISEGDVVWRAHRLTTADLALTRAHLVRSVGSCSFEDAVNDLRDLGWLPP